MDVSKQRVALPSSRILLIRPDAYGDIVLFEPVLRCLRTGLPQAQVAVVVRESFLDVAHLLPEGVCWIGSGCDPYRYGPDAAVSDLAMAQLREQVVHFEPDCVVAACYSKTWFEAVVASWFPTARKISLGPYKLDLVSACVLEESWPEAKPALFTEWIDVPWDMVDWQKNVRLAQTILGKPLSLNTFPQIRVPDSSDQWARHHIAELGLAEGEYVACCPAGTTKVSIKAWPVEGYATVLAQLTAKHGVQPLLLGSRRELPVLEKVRYLAAEMGLKTVAVWTGEGGDINHLAALLRLARLYVGNDTGAMHFAAALNVPGVAVFGGGTWPRFIPAGRGYVTVVQPLPCFGCGWNCPLGDAPCVGRIPADEVFAAVDRVIQGSVVAEGEVHEVARLVTNEEIARASSWRVQGVDELKQRDTVSVMQLLRKLRESEADRAARLEVIEAQGRQIGRIAQLEAQLEASEADRAARLEVIEAQGRQIGRIAQIEMEKAQLEAQLEASEADRAARLEFIESQGQQLGQLIAQLEACEADCAGLYANWLIKIGIKTGLVSTKRE